MKSLKNKAFEMVSAEGVQPLAEPVNFVDFFHIFSFQCITLYIAVFYYILLHLNRTSTQKCYFLFEPKYVTNRSFEFNSFCLMSRYSKIFFLMKSRQQHPKNTANIIEKIHNKISGRGKLAKDEKYWIHIFFQISGWTWIK